MVVELNSWVETSLKMCSNNGTFILDDLYVCPKKCDFLFCCCYCWCSQLTSTVHCYDKSYHRNVICQLWLPSLLTGLFQTEGEQILGTRCDYQFVNMNKSVTRGRFYSPRYPSNYPPNTRCAYLFIGKLKEKVKLIFENVSLYHGDDRLVRNILSVVRKSVFYFIK